MEIFRHLTSVCPLDETVVATVGDKVLFSLRIQFGFAEGAGTALVPY